MEIFSSFRTRTLKSIFLWRKEEEEERIFKVFQHRKLLRTPFEVNSQQFRLPLLSSRENLYPFNNWNKMVHFYELHFSWKVERKLFNFTSFLLFLMGCWTCERATAMKESCISDTKCCRKSTSLTPTYTCFAECGEFQRAKEAREVRNVQTRHDRGTSTLQLESYN